MQQSPISFRLIFSSIAASLLINGAALCLFFVHLKNPIYIPAKENSITVSLVDATNAGKKSQNIKKRIEAFCKADKHKNKKGTDTVIKMNKKHRTMKKTVLYKKPYAEKYHLFLHKKFIKHTKRAKTLTKTARLKRYADIGKQKSKINRAPAFNSIYKIKKTIGLSKPTVPINNTNAVSKKPTKAQGYFQIKISKRSFGNIFSWISKHKFYPMEALYKEEEGRIALRFIISSSGLITKIGINKPSKYEILNTAALKILRSSSPIPKSLLSHINRFPAKAEINIVFNIE